MSGGFDPTTPSIARVNDFLLGGKDNFAADRAMAAKALEVAPELLVLMREWRSFIRRVVRFLAETGIRQFIDIGGGLPTRENVHEIAQAVAPDARVAYVASDPVIFAHAQAWLASNPLTAAVQADVYQPDQVLGHPALNGFMDLAQPVAILLFTVLHTVPVDGEVERIISGFRTRIAAGSYVVIQHAVSDICPEVTGNLTRLYQENKVITGTRRVHNTRTKARIERFLDGFELVDPGLVYLPEWRPDPGTAAVDPGLIWLAGGVGRKT